MDMTSHLFNGFKTEIEFVRDLYEKTTPKSQDGKSRTSTLCVDDSCYLVIEKHFKIRKAVKISLTAIQTLSSKSPDYIDEGSLKTIMKGTDLLNQNLEIVLAVFRNRSPQELNLKGAIETTRLFKDPKYFVFGKWIQFYITNEEGQSIKREAYLMPKKRCNFQKYLDSNPNLTESKMIQILLPAVIGTCKMHQAGIIHRDLKPENLLVDEDGAKLADPDTAIRTNQALNLSCTVLFTAPEIFSNIEPDENSGDIKINLPPDAAKKIDVYAWGAILYRAVTGMDLLELPGIPLYDETVDEWNTWDWSEEDQKKDLSMAEKAKYSCKLVRAYIENSYRGILKAQEYLKTHYESLQPDILQTPLLHVAWRCINPCPIARPSMEEVLGILESILKQSRGE